MTKPVKLMDAIKLQYHEESIKPAVISTLVVLIIIALPLGWIISNTGDKGVNTADMERYRNLAMLMDSNVSGIRKILANDVVDDKSLTAITAAPAVTLITPNISPTNRDEATQGNTKELHIKLNAIYWSPRDPLVTLNGENYRVGEKIQGYTITEIRKTEVVFKSPLGETAVKYFYDYLDI